MTTRRKGKAFSLYKEDENDLTYKKNKELSKFLSKNDLAKSKIILSDKQQKFYDLIRDNIISVCTGPHGTSKTFVSCFAALNLLVENEVSQIILTKPIQESGENIGFLKGTLAEKIDPYIQSYKSTFLKMISVQQYEYMIANNIIKFEPLAYMLGQTFDDCVMLLDEAQNLTVKQLMLWTGRIGKNTKAIITGDINQYYIKKSDVKLNEFKEQILKGINDIGTFEFEKQDIVRNKILIEITDKYEQYMMKNPNIDK